jgi:ATP-dependent DNA helicase PIF1
MREKAKVDLKFQRRLLEFIGQVASETLPPSPSISIQEEFKKGSRVFQPLLNPDHPYFDDQMKVDVYDIVTTRNMHNRKHTPTCFKYGRKRCRARFPRKLVAHTQFNPETGVIEIERDDEWLNGYNKWLSLMTRANHDCQFLLTKDHAIAIIYYIMKYISKPEAASHTKLTVSAAVRDAMQNSTADYMSDVDVTKRFLIKIYNKLDTQREVGVPEAISHLLNISDHYTDSMFERLHTSHLLRYVDRLSLSKDEQPDSDNEQDETLDSQLIVSNNKYTIISPFDNYAHRGPSFANYCLYDYVSMVYKSKEKGGVHFETEHPQHKSHRQFVRQQSYAIPNLLGRLLFVSKSSRDLNKQNDYYRIVCWLFIPWSFHSPHVVSDGSWKEFYEANIEGISPRLLYHIDNLDLLHKSKEESQIDVLQQKARSDEKIVDGWEDDRMLDGSDNDDSKDSSDYENDTNDDVDVVVEEIISSSSTERDDWYVHEAIDAHLDAGYFPSQQPDTTFTDMFHHCSISVDELKHSIEMVKQEIMEQAKRIAMKPSVRQPLVFITGPAEMEVAIQMVVEKYTLNKEQARAFSIIAKHSLGQSKVGSQLLMGTFGEGGTGKSRIIEAIRDWFGLINQGKRLSVTATTGAAAAKINGSTLHSTAAIPVEAGDGDKQIKLGKATDKQVLVWKELDYIVIDEVSMMDSKVMMQLNKNLSLFRGSNKEHDGKPFGGVNVLFYGDFLQLPSVSKLDLWRTHLGRWQQGHDLWRSLNAVVILTQQMRQAEDSVYAEAMARIRVHQPTDQDIAMLNSRIGVPIPDSSAVPTIVQRHYVRHAINLQKLKETAASNNLQILHCKAEVIVNHGFSLRQLYSIIQGPKKALGDGVLSVIPGAPLMITKNLNYLPVSLVNGAIVKFYGFSDTTNRGMTSAIIDLPQYMLVRLQSKEKVIQISGLPENVVPIWPESFKYNLGHGKWARLYQFPVTLAYAITDFKCQAQTYQWVRVDIKKPHTGAASVMSPYVQLSRAQSLQRLSILRPFDPEDLRAPIPEELKAELEWEQKMNVLTAEIYP